MSRDKAEHRVQTHRIAVGRRAVGQPGWAQRIYLGDVFHNEDLTFVQRRDAVMRRLRASRWVRDSGDDTALTMLLDDLAEAADAEEFDEVWDEIYDIADYDRVWIDTVSVARWADTGESQS